MFRNITDGAVDLRPEWEEEFQDAIPINVQFWERHIPAR